MFLILRRLSLLGFLILFIAPALALDAPKAEEKMGLSVTLKGWYLFNGDSSLHRSGQVFGSTTDRLNDEFAFGDDGAFFMGDLRFEQWGDVTFWSLNFSGAYNDFIQEDTQLNETVVNTTNQTFSYVAIEGETDAIDWNVNPHIGFGFGFRDGISFETSLGFYYRRLDMKIEDISLDINGTTGTTSGKFAGYDVDFWAGTWDFTIKFPVDPDCRFWIKLYARTTPYSEVYSTFETSDVRIDMDGSTAFSSWALEASVIAYLWQDTAFAVRVEAGYRYFHWRSSNLSEKHLTKSTGGIVLSESADIETDQEGPFVAATVEF